MAVFTPRLNEGAQIAAWNCWRAAVEQHRRGEPVETIPRNILVEGGFRAGKSELGYLLFTDALWLNKCVNGLATGTSYGTVDEDMLPRIELMTWKYGLRPKLHASHRVLELRTLRNRLSKFGKHVAIYCRSAHNAERIEAIGVGVTLSDERGRWREYPHDMKRDGARAVTARMSDDRARFPMQFDVGTPEGKSTSTYREYHEHPTAQHRRFTMPTSSNAHNLNPGYIPALRGAFDAIAIRQYEWGEPTDVGIGFAYQGYGEQCNGEVRYRPDMPLWICWDFGTAMGCVIIAQPQGEPPDCGVHILGEVIDQGGASTGKLLTGLKDWLVLNRIAHENRVLVFGDASGDRADTRGNQDDWRIVHAGLPSIFSAGQLVYKVEDSNPPVRERVLRVRSLFGDANGRVRLRLDPKKSPVLHKDFGAVQWKNDKLDHGSDGLLTHTSDSFGYAVWPMFPFVSPLIGNIQTEGIMHRVSVGDEPPPGWKYGDLARSVDRWAERT